MTDKVPELRVRELERSAFPGGVMLLALLAMAIGWVMLLVYGARNDNPIPIVIGLFGGFCTFISLFGLIVVNPNEAKVLQFFGKYVGTIKTDGWYWVNPFYSKTRISLRILNFETDHLKVNDLDGNPIEIAAIVVWKVVETAEASFAVADYQDYVEVQSEAALRNLATQYPYDVHEEDQVSLRGHTQAVADRLKEEIQDRLDQAGVAVIEARISHLAYSPEIAQAMLQRQQAGAIIAARQKIVEGAVGMVEMALEMLAKTDVVQLDGDQRAAMVSNLLVVLCGDRSTQPVVNTGTLNP